MFGGGSDFVGKPKSCADHLSKNQFAKCAIAERLLMAQSGHCDGELGFRLLLLAGPSSNFPMMDWTENLDCSIG
jgi:hypothetical protein